MIQHIEHAFQLIFALFLFMIGWLVIREINAACQQQDETHVNHYHTLFEFESEEPCQPLQLTHEQTKKPGSWND